MAKISKFTRVSVVSSMEEKEASAILTSLIYTRGKFSGDTETEFRTTVHKLINDFHNAGVLQNGSSST